MDDFLKFKKMITPIIIQVLFWVGVVISVVVGLGMMVAGERGDAASGLLVIFLGPVGVRIYCELLIVVFSINDTLTDIKNLLRSRTP